MPLWTPVENPGTRPPRSWVFDIGCALFAALASFGSFSFAQAAHPAHPALAIGLYPVAATMSRATAPAAAALAVAAEVPAAGPGGWQVGWPGGPHAVIPIAAVPG